ncbi:zinc transporter ZIP10 [Caerostris darwini]|uniref:Zinc transporter ZIP10 n=1 Tax=Caerostris darwini TaxID=1538125 RepID=A0AAV4QRT2_9ARAC|nr:zinc transporter ZIP10 [Caerostris darwini]
MGAVGFYIVGALVSAHVSLCLCHFSPTERSREITQEPESSPVPPISDHRFFLHEIFTKYGHGGQMTFEGFEHLLESLGLGNIIINDHDMEAHKENDFRNLHDTHDHSKKTEVMTGTTSKGVTLPNRDTRSHSHNHRDHDHHHHHHNEGTTSPGHPSTLVRHPHHSHDNSLPTSQTQLDNSSTNHLHLHRGNITESGNRSNADASPESIYHYRLSDVKIPELLVNLSILVDQHQELDQRSPDMVIEQCLSPREILETFGINQTSSLNPVSFLHLCPAIIYELDQGHCLFKNHGHAEERIIASTHQWIFSTIAVVIISLCGLLSVAVVPIMQKWFYHTLIQFLIGLAVGSLTGDALLHLMPHAMLGGEAGHDHNGPMSAAVAEKVAIWRGLTALGGMFFFFIAERLLGNYASYRKQRKELKAGKSKIPSLSNQSQVLNNGSVGEKLSQYRKSSYDFETSEKEMIKSEY